MSGDHPRMQDLEGHVDAVASDLEYFRRKRIEPRILLYLRWGGAIGWADSFWGRRDGRSLSDVSGPKEDSGRRVAMFDPGDTHLI